MIVACRNTDECIEAIKTHGSNISAMILDDWMGGTSGVSLINDIRAGKQGEAIQNIPIMLMSGNLHTINCTPPVIQCSKGSRVDRDILAFVEGYICNQAKWRAIADRSLSTERAQEARDFAARILNGLLRATTFDDYRTIEGEQDMAIEMQTLSSGEAREKAWDLIDLMKKYVDSAFTDGTPSREWMVDLFYAVKNNNLYIPDDQRANEFFAIKGRLGELLVHALPEEEVATVLRQQRNLVKPNAPIKR
jgi:CheY-like chemotaxis protein